MKRLTKKFTWFGTRQAHIALAPKGRRHKTTLKAKLLVTVALLVMAGLGVADITTYTALRSFLYEKLDQQLTSSIDPTAQVLFAAYNGVDSGRGLSALVPSGSWGELISTTGARFSVAFIQPGQAQDSPPLLVPQNGTRITSIPINVPYSVPSISNEHFKYRVIAVRSANGKLTVVLAIPESALQATLSQLGVVTALVSVALLVTLVALGFYLIGLGLAPLDRMTETAEQISKGDFTKRIEAQSRDAEVEKLTDALNTMLETIEAAIEQREASEARLKRFVADASHELRTPLTSIRGYAELIESGIVVGEQDINAAAHRINSESQRMAGLVEDLLLLARLDQSRPLEKVEVDLSKLVQDAVTDERVIEPQRPIQIEIEPNITVIGDEARLIQVIGNLLSNLRSHTSADTWAKISLKRVESERGPHAILEVADQGPGMDQDQLRHAFERFYRADPSRARAQGGAGLGLSLVASIAEAQGGRAWITSPGPNQGATAGIELPIAEVEPVILSPK